MNIKKLLLLLLAMTGLLGCVGASAEYPTGSGEPSASKSKFDILEEDAEAWKKRDESVLSGQQRREHYARIIQNHEKIKQIREYVLQVLSNPQCHAIGHAIESLRKDAASFPFEAYIYNDAIAQLQQKQPAICGPQ